MATSWSMSANLSTNYIELTHYKLLLLCSKLNKKSQEQNIISATFLQKTNFKAVMQGALNVWKVWWLLKKNIWKKKILSIYQYSIQPYFFLCLYDNFLRSYRSLFVYAPRLYECVFLYKIIFILLVAGFLILW